MAEKTKKKFRELTASIERKNKKPEKNPNSKGQRENQAYIPARLNLLFFVIFALFVALIIQLAYLQIANAELFQTKISMAETKTLTGNTPRGGIYDANGVALATNEAKPAILYTKSGNISAEEQLRIANKLNELIDVEAEDLTERDKKDYWLADERNLKNAQKRLKEAETKDKNGDLISETELYPKIVDKVKEEEIAYDEQTLRAATIFKRINGAYALTTVFIKNNNVTPEEMARVGETISELPGVSTGTDWSRQYPQSGELRDILGTISSEKTGLPAEELDNYLLKGYARNDRVGLSYLEKQYEPVLRGTKSQYEIALDKQEQIEKQTELYPGEKGKNLQLTIDLEFNRKVNEIVRNVYGNILSSGIGQYSDGAYVVVSDPKTGDIKALAGIKHNWETNETEEDVLGTFNNQFIPGSSIKGATIAAGYQQGVISGNEVLVDEPIRIQGSAPKTSVFNRSGQVEVSAVNALRQSSNAYMMKIVFKMLGVEYKAGMTMPLDTSVFEKLRKTYAEFGLGTTTGIDLPSESFGFINANYFEANGKPIEGIMGNLLDLSYGNYDTYTPLQLNQYVSTIANGGKRMAPRVVKGIYGSDENGNLGDLEKIIEPKILNEVSISQEELAIIQDGFYQVVNNGGTGRNLSSAKYTVSGKTGTAEVTRIYDGKEVQLDNSTFVGYAPSDNPKVAISVMLPQVTKENGENLAIAKEVLDAYYDMYEGKE